MKYNFKLYIVENTTNSVQQIERLKAFFDSAMKDNYALEIVDVLTRPEKAIDNNIMATPTLVMELPPPEKRLVGNITDEESILLALNIITDKNKQ